jgi:hypothetical protein
MYYQLIFLYPICPHFCEVAYLDYFLPFTAEEVSRYPEYLGDCDFLKPKVKIEEGAIYTQQYVLKLKSQIRKLIKKNERTNRRD